MNCPDATRNGDVKNSTEEFQWLRSGEFQSLHRTVVVGSIVLLVSTLAVTKWKMKMSDTVALGRASVGSELPAGSDGSRSQGVQRRSLSQFRSGEEV